MNDDDSILSKCKVRVTLPTKSVICLILVLPAVVVGRDVDGVEELARLAGPHDDLVLVSADNKVPIKIHGDVSWSWLQSKPRIVTVDGVDQVSRHVVAVDLPTIEELSQDDNHVAVVTCAKIGSICITVIFDIIIKQVLLQLTRAGNVKDVYASESGIARVQHLLDDDPPRHVDTHHLCLADHRYLLNKVFVAVKLVIHSYLNRSLILNVFTEINNNKFSIS